MKISKEVIQALNIIFNNEIKPSGFLTNTFFQDLGVVGDRVQLTNIFDTNILPPYITPCMDGIPVYQEAGTKSEYKIPYIGLEDVLTPCDVNDIGLFINGTLRQINLDDATARWQAGATKVLQVQKNAVSTVEEKQAVSFLLDGKIDTRSSYANGEIIDFRRSSDLTLTLANYWTDNTVNPNNTFTSAGALLRNQGYLLSDIVMSGVSWNTYINNAKIQELSKSPANAPWVAQQVAPLPYIYNGVQTYNLPTTYTGVLRVHVYEDAYQTIDNSSGTPKRVNNKFLPDDRIIFIGKRAEGYSLGKVYGEIKHKLAIKANQTKVKWFQTVWENKNADELITCSAPFALGDVNSCFSVKVLP